MKALKKEQHKVSVDCRDDSEQGSVIPLIVGMCALLVLIASVILAITGAHVQTQRLTDFADAQASAVAKRLSNNKERAVNTSGVNSSLASAYASEYLAASGASAEFDSVSIESVDVSDGASVRVTLRARIHPPLVSIVVPDGIQVRAYASSRMETTQ